MYRNEFFIDPVVTDPCTGAGCGGLCGNPDVTIYMEGNTESGITLPAIVTGPAGHLIQDEGSDLAQQNRLNFVGGGVAAVNDPANSRTTVRIPGTVSVFDDGVFIVECNYWGGMVKHNNYALIYHDHYSYFTLQNWVDLLAMHGLEIFDAYVTEAQGDGLSLRLYADNAIRVPTKSFLDLLEEEKKTKLNSSKVCNQFLEGVTNKAKELKKIVVSIKESGKSIAGYGAAAKGFSILKLAEIDEKHIDYFVDDSPAKQGKYTPVSHIPVISRQAAENRLPDYFFITAPNYATVIIEKEQNFLDKGGKFLLESSEIVG